jgi:MFS family permease
MSRPHPGGQIPAGSGDAETSRDAGRASAGGPPAGFALLLSLSMAQFMVVLDFTIVNVALPSIQRDLHVPTTTLQWVISGYAVAFGGFLLLGGRLADAYGRARHSDELMTVTIVGGIQGCA